MTCWDASAGGEMVCPSPSAPSWLTDPLPYTGFEVAVVAAFALFFLVVGAAIVVWSQR